MKKTIGSILLAVGASALLMTGCAKKVTVNVMVPELGECELAELPEGTENFSMNDGIATVTLKKEGDYDIVLKDEDDKEHTITIKYHDGAVEGSAEEGLSLYIGTGDASALKSLNLEDISTEAESAEAGTVETETEQK